MSEGDLSELEPVERLEAALAMIRSVLAEIGIERVSRESVVTGPAETALVRDDATLGQFLMRLALGGRFVGYPPDVLAGRTVAEIAEMYVRDSYPEPPSTPLPDDAYVWPMRRAPRRASGPRDLPICFILGCGRSGTTLLRAMLNAHEELWAPGELHLANFDGLGERSRNITPTIRHMLVPEVAARFGQDRATFSQTFRAWEDEDLPTAEFYQRLYDAAPDTLIVDKTPPYGEFREDLDWIGAVFPRARFVHLVRSPHDVIRSYVRMQLYRGAGRRYAPDLDPYQLGEAEWFVNNTNTEQFLNTLPPGRTCRIRYEDLVADPERWLHAIAELLDVAYDRRMADPYQGRKGRVARGAGDMIINLLNRVERRAAGDAFFPLGARCRILAERYGY